METYVLTIGVPIESEEQLQDMLGRVFVDGGLVSVAATGTQVGEECQLRATGNVAAILSWLDSLWGSSELALDAMIAARQAGNLVAKTS